MAHTTLRRGACQGETDTCIRAQSPVASQVPDTSWLAACTHPYPSIHPSTSSFISLAYLPYCNQVWQSVPLYAVLVFWPRSIRPHRPCSSLPDRLDLTDAPHPVSSGHRVSALVARACRRLQIQCRLCTRCSRLSYKNNSNWLVITDCPCTCCTAWPRQHAGIITLHQDQLEIKATETRRKPEASRVAGRMFAHFCHAAAAGSSLASPSSNLWSWQTNNLDGRGKATRSMAPR
ncbi:uncharacterized protein F5Z01DRAFT_316930 [Emericellopsis atlantica]|uniref:Uncharacterized protein n=1 Tax=Emericellopsis atlantica TaxID=2614577 RepID=A0A9P8CVB7_9HYPO|nr:uncharacterized protein F5Z01DRAFT_316930 [Emericellopsis atlantica]KAG9258091.1 hypothetical protein F5Z01DRAFT_316930 [Emericellopsis atlantica]